MTEDIKGIIEDIKKLVEEDETPKNMKKYVGGTFNVIELNLLLNYITNLQKENEELLKKLENVSLDEANIRADILLEQQDYKSRNEKAIEYIKKDTRWFDSEYAKTYGMLCDCEGAKGDRLEVLVNPTNLLNVLKGGDE